MRYDIICIWTGQTFEFRNTPTIQPGFLPTKNDDMEVLPTDTVAEALTKLTAIGREADVHPFQDGQRQNGLYRTTILSVGGILIKEDTLENQKDKMVPPTHKFANPEWYSGVEIIDPEWYATYDHAVWLSTRTVSSWNWV